MENIIDREECDLLTIKGYSMNNLKNKIGMPDYKNSLEQYHSSPNTILIIDDHPLFRIGIHFLLEQLEDSLTVIESSSYEDAVQHADMHSVDLILLDLKMPGVSGFSAMEKLINQYQVPVVIISGGGDPTTILKLIECGACGFIPKAISPDVLVAALRLVLAGGIYIPPEALRPCTDSLIKEQRDNDFELMFTKLSERQRGVLRLAITGKANKVIAKELTISEGTVKSHLSLAYKTLGVKNRTEAILTLAHIGQEGYSL